MMAFAFIGLMRIMASPEKTVVARPAPASPSVHLRGAFLRPWHAVRADGKKVLHTQFLDPLLRFTSGTPVTQIQASAGLSESCPKIGDIPKSPFPSVAALVPSAGTITT